MNVVEKLTDRWRDIDYPFLVHSSGELRFDEISEQKAVDLSEVKRGDVVVSSQTLTLCLINAIAAY